VSGAGGGYPSDLTDEQWALVEPLLPRARVGPKGGRREKHPRRRIVDAIFYVVRTGCAWRQLPKDFAPWPTVYWYFTWWHDDGAVERIHDALRSKVREAEGRDAEPSAGLIDSQSVRTADTVPPPPGASMRVRRSRAARGSPSPTPSVCSWLSTSSRQASRTATARSGRCCGPGSTTPGSGRSGQTRALPAVWSTGPPRSSAASWRLSARIPTSAASRFSPSAGWWSGCAVRRLLIVWR
jgi:transposase